VIDTNGDRLAAGGPIIAAVSSIVSGRR